MNRSPPNHAAMSARKPTAKPVQCRRVKYITARAGAMAKKTVPTNRALKLEKVAMGYPDIRVPARVAASHTQGKRFWKERGAGRAGQIYFPDMFTHGAKVFVVSMNSW